MDAALALVVFAPALALGSFLNVVAARLPVPGPAVGWAVGRAAIWAMGRPVFDLFRRRSFRFGS